MESQKFIALEWIFMHSTGGWQVRLLSSYVMGALFQTVDKTQQPALAAFIALPGWSPPSRPLTGTRPRHEPGHGLEGRGYDEARRRRRPRVRPSPTYPSRCLPIKACLLCEPVSYPSPILPFRVTRVSHLGPDLSRRLRTCRCHAVYRSAPPPRDN